MGYIAQMVSGGTPSKDNPSFWRGSIPWVSPKDMKRREISDSIDHVSELAVSDAGLVRLVPPVALIVVRGMILAHTFPVAITRSPVTINQDMKALRFDSDVNGDYFVYLLEGMSRFVLSLVEEAGHGTKRLRTDLWRAIELFLPTLDEQRAIADFLDQETSKIDALVAKKERLIELLQEKRTALITHAVTKGLDPNAPMKPSGIDWLSDIPEHWEVTRVKRAWAKCEYGLSENLSGVGEIRILTMGNIQDGEVILPERGCLDSVPEYLLLEHHDLLFNRTNSRDLVGKVGLFRGKKSDRVSFASYLVRISARPDVSPEYLNYLLNSQGLRSRARSEALLSINQANLNPTRYGQLEIVLPPIAEQETIVASLNAEAATINFLLVRIRDAIEVISEYRTALISAAVTGKIDVRDEVA